MARLDKMTKPELIGVIERDAVTVRRARQALADIAAMQRDRDAAQAALELERAKPPATVERIKRVEVPVEKIVEKIVTRETPTPCPEQAAEIDRLRADLNDFNRPEFRQWQKMRKVAGSE